MGPAEGPAVTGPAEGPAGVGPVEGLAAAGLAGVIPVEGPAAEGPAGVVPAAGPVGEGPVGAADEDAAMGCPATGANLGTGGRTLWRREVNGREGDAAGGVGREGRKTGQECSWQGSTATTIW